MCICVCVCGLLSGCLAVCLSICLSVCLSVCRYNDRSKKSRHNLDSSMRQNKFLFPDARPTFFFFFFYPILNSLPLRQRKKNSVEQTTLGALAKQNEKRKKDRKKEPNHLPTFPFFMPCRNKDSERGVKQELYEQCNIFA